MLFATLGNSICTEYSSLLKAVQKKQRVGEEVEDNSNNENDEASVDQNKSFVTALERIDVSSNEEEAKDNNYNDQNNIFDTNNKEIVKNPVYPPIIKDNNEDRQTLAQQKCHSKKRRNRRKQVRLLNGRIVLRPTNMFFFGVRKTDTICMESQNG